MKRLFLLLTAFALLTAPILANDLNSKVKQTNTGDLVSQLPPSDVIATVNLKRLMNEVAPQLLSSQPAKLTELNAKIDEIKTKTGIDLRQYEQLAIGMTAKQIRSGVLTYEPVMLVRGTFSSNALLIAGKLAANGKHRQEAAGGKNMVIFTLPQQAKDAVQAPANQNDIFGDMLNKLAAQMGGEVALAALDDNTLAFGKPEQVRRLLTVRIGVSADLKAMVNRNPNALLSFAGNAPVNAAAMANLGDDQFAQILNSLKQVYGSLDMNANNALVTLATRTDKETEAQRLEGIVAQLRDMGKSFFSVGNNEKNQIATRVLETVKISRSINEVQLQAEVALSDIGTLTIKK